MTKTYVKKLRDDEAKEAADLAARINVAVLAKTVVRADDTPRPGTMAVKIIDRDTEIVKILSRKDIERLRSKGYILKRNDGTIIDTLKDM